MGAIRYLADKLVNFTSAMGTERDKASQSFYACPTLSDVEASNMYRGTWLARKIVDIPALDATRRWRAWQAESEQIGKLEAEEKRLNLRAKVREAMELARLRGGAAIYIGTGESDSAKPLQAERIGTGGIRFLTVMDRTRLTPGDEELDPAQPGFGQPMWYEISGTGAQVRIHPSRLVLFYGARVARDLQRDSVTSGAHGWAWGDSVLLAIKSALLNADNTDGNIASMVFEANVDVFRIPGLMQQIEDPQYRQNLMTRMSLAATLKGTNGMLVMDKDEEYDRKSQAFATLPDVMDRFMQRVAGAADIPATRLLGQSPAGLSSTGESDLRNYYDRISSLQELDMQPALTVLDECLIRSALGSRPAELHYVWRSLWQPTATEQSEIAKRAAETINTLKQSGLFADEPLSRAAENMLTELGAMPGLESAMAEWEAEGNDRIDETEAPEPDDELLPAPASSRQQLGDAKPAPLYVQRKVVNTAEILAWARSQGFKSPEPAEDLHVTVAYSRTAVDWIKMGQDFRDGVTVSAGGPRAVEALGDGGAVVLFFASDDLSWRHREMVERGASFDYDEYQPHVTITYDLGDVDLSKVEPYRGKIEFGPEIFEPLKLD